MNRIVNVDRIEKKRELPLTNDEGEREWMYLLSFERLGHGSAHDEVEKKIGGNGEWRLLTVVTFVDRYFK